MYLKVLICCVLTVVVVHCQGITSKVADAKVSLLYSVRRIPYPRIVMTSDGYENYLTTFYNIPATYRCHVIIVGGLRVVNDLLTGLRYVILGSDSTSDLSLAQLYTDKAGSNVIFNPNTNAYEKISFDANGKMIFTIYTDVGKLIAFKLSIRQYVLPDDNGNEILVTLDISSNSVYRFAVYNDSQTLIPYTYSLLTGQGFLVYHDQWACKIKLYKLERDLSGNFIAQDVTTGERRFVFYDEYGQLTFAPYPNYPPPKTTLTNILNLQTGSVSVPAKNAVY